MLALGRCIASENNATRRLFRGGTRGNACLIVKVLKNALHALETALRLNTRQISKSQGFRI